MPYNWGEITSLETKMHFQALVNLSASAIASMPFIRVTREEARRLRQELLFVHIGHYGQHVKLHCGEIGHYKSTRYIHADT